MSQPRAAHTATPLADGRVLVVGGYPGEGRPPTPTVEVYDAATGRFSGTGALHVARADHSATLLADGRVLVAGGFGVDGTALDSTEVYDPASGRFTTGPRLSSPRADHVAVRDGDHLVLVGGTVDGGALATTDVLAGDDWSPGARLTTGRVKHAVVVLPGHRLFVVGGATDVEGRTRLDSTEILPATGDRSRPGPRLSEPEYKLDGAVVTLADRRVVIAGGRRVDVYDPSRNRMQVLARPVLPRLSFRTANVVGPRTVLLAGGYDDAIVPTDQLVLVAVPPRRTD